MANRARKMVKWSVSRSVRFTATKTISTESPDAQLQPLRVWVELAWGVVWTLRFFSSSPGDPSCSQGSRCENFGDQQGPALASRTPPPPQKPSQNGGRFCAVFDLSRPISAPARCDQHEATRFPAPLAERGESETVGALRPR